MNQEQLGGVEAFRAGIVPLAEKLRAATHALSAANSQSAADAAAVQVRQVSEAEKRVKEAARAMMDTGVTLEQLYEEGQLVQMLGLLPVAEYTETVQKQLKEGCQGSTQLFLAICEREDEKVVGALQPAEVQDLKQVEKLFTLLREIAPVSHWRALEADFVKLYDEVLPVVARLQQNPVTAMHLRQLIEQNEQALHELCNNRFHGNGNLEERFLLRKDDFLGTYYSRSALAEYFYMRAGEWDEKRLELKGNKLWNDAAARLEDFRRKHDLGKGDGRTPETAFEIPATVEEKDYAAFVNRFTREVFGELHLPAEFRFSSLSSTGRQVIYGLVYAGRSGNGNSSYDPVLVMPCYFNLPEKKEDTK